MYRTRSTLVLALFAVALIAVPAAFAKGRDHRALRVQGLCTQQSTSQLKLKREDRRIEVEFEVDQNQSGVPWLVTISRNDTVVASFTATTQAPSGSFEVERRIAGRLSADRITVVATRTGETCTADSTSAKVKPQVPATAPAPTAADDDNGDDNGGDNRGGDDDSGHHSGSHS